MREAINFNYAGIASEDMGVHIASAKTGLFEDLFTPNRSLVETVTPYRDTPYFHGYTLEPISFPLTIFIEEWRDRDNLRQVARWLSQNYYKPLIFDSNTHRVYFAMIEGASQLRHNGAKDGYIEVNVRCNSPYIYSHPIEMSYEITGAEDLLIYNNGDIPVKPLVTIEKLNGLGDIVIENKTTGQMAELNDIGQDEIVTIDFENEIVKSSHEDVGVYRYDDFNNVWLYLCHESENALSITGDCKIKLEFRSKYWTE